MLCEKCGGLITPQSLDKPNFPHLQDEKFNHLFQEHLKTKGVLKTDRAIKARLKKLQAVDLESAINALNDSIDSGWKGVFPKQRKVKHESFAERDDRNIGDLFRSTERLRQASSLQDISISRGNNQVVGEQEQINWQGLIEGEDQIFNGDLD